MQGERQKAETAMRPAAMERAGYWFPIGDSNFNGLRSHNPPDPKHYPHLGFQGLTPMDCSGARTGLQFRRVRAAAGVTTPVPPAQKF
jgi:hypothetical protein